MCHELEACAKATKLPPCAGSTRTTYAASSLLSTAKSPADTTGNPVDVTGAPTLTSTAPPEALPRGCPCTPRAPCPCAGCCSLRYTSMDRRISGGSSRAIPPQAPLLGEVHPPVRVTWTRVPASVIWKRSSSAARTSLRSGAIEGVAKFHNPRWNCARRDRNARRCEAETMDDCGWRVVSWRWTRCKLQVVRCETASTVVIRVWFDRGERLLGRLAIGKARWSFMSGASMQLI
eukprot:1189041-Prorocentrum_minimum.AAC.2